jgi:hypothetical protein
MCPIENANRQKKIFFQQLENYMGQMGHMGQAHNIIIILTVPLK